jgi:hypothetical protein
MGIQKAEHFSVEECNIGIELQIVNTESRGGKTE